MGIPKQISIKNLSNPLVNQVTAKLATNFWDRLFGLMTKSSIGEYDGLLLENSSRSRIGSSIHMMFMRFNLGVIWIDDLLQVTQVIEAPRWKPWIIPQKPAKFILEIHPANIQAFSIGDKLGIEKIN